MALLYSAAMIGLPQEWGLPSSGCRCASELRSAGQCCCAARGKPAGSCCGNRTRATGNMEKAVVDEAASSEPSGLAGCSTTCRSESAGQSRENSSIESKTQSAKTSCCEQTSVPRSGPVKSPSRCCCCRSTIKEETKSDSSEPAGLSARCSCGSDSTGLFAIQDPSIANAAMKVPGELPGCSEFEGDSPRVVNPVHPLETPPPKAA